MTTIRGVRLPGLDRSHHHELHFETGVMTDPRPGDETIDADGLIVSPGLIDLQINGGFGYDFTHDPTTIWTVGERLPELGVTAFTPTIVTSPDEVTDLAIDVVAKRRPESYRGAEVLGLHFEGPWISEQMHGAHNPAHITDPDPIVAGKWADSGVVRIVTLAPEKPGSAAVLSRLTGGGVVVSAGHSAADFETATHAFRRGASLATHLYNQMSPLRHGEPGMVGAALLTARHCLLIVDGLHMATGALEIAWRILGARRVALVSDAMAALGLGPGTYPLGDGPITVGERGPRTTDGRLAGSVGTLPEAVRLLATSTSADLGEAFDCASATPAAVLGITDRGRLSHGARADITLLDEHLDVVATFVGGERLYG